MKNIVNCFFPDSAVFDRVSTAIRIMADMLNGANQKWIKSSQINSFFRKKIIVNQFPMLILHQKLELKYCLRIRCFFLT